MEACKRLLRSRGVRVAGGILCSLLVFAVAQAPTATHAENERVITIFHDGMQQTIVTDAPTIDEALKRAEVPLEEKDAVEPARDTKLTAPSYDVNVYRARPVTIVDGSLRYTVMSPHTSARQIVAGAGLTLHDEDTYELTRINEFLHEGGVGLKLTITRAVPITFMLYGTETPIRTQAKTVGDLLKEKQVSLGEQDGVNLPLGTAIKESMKIEVWRNGVQTKTEEQEIDFKVEQIRDVDKPMGFKEIKTPGVKGKKLVTYEVELKNGQMVRKKEIQSVTTAEPKKQVEVVGAKPQPGNGLSKSKGVNYFVDSKGIRHRETYYDLRMSGVMGFCGGGTYSVRSDGAKVDQDGYILVAANLNRYPRCSIVETSLGLGKVYDTGGFASIHADGFDLATDWSNYDGR